MDVIDQFSNKYYYLNKDNTKDKYLIKRINQFNKIYQTDISKRDNIFMKNYKNLLPNKKLFEYEIAIERLNSKNFTKKLIEELKNNNIDCLIFLT